MKDYIYDVDSFDIFNLLYNNIFTDIQYSSDKRASFIDNERDKFNDIRKYLEGSMGLEKRTSLYYDSVAKLEVDKREKFKTNADIIAINSLLDEIDKLDLQSKLSVKSPTIKQVSAYSAFNTQDTTVLNQYITYEQTKETDKARLKGNPNITFNMLSHANRSIYVQEF
jgi:hypothetical protein